MEERRKLERFEIHAPARVLIDSQGDARDEYNLTTRDVSSAGVFLFSSQNLPEGASVRMEFLISSRIHFRHSPGRRRGQE